MGKLRANRRNWILDFDRFMEKMESTDAMVEESHRILDQLSILTKKELKDNATQTKEND